MDTPVKYFEYLRKSSEDKKRQAISIPAQESELLTLIEQDALTIVDIFRESHSAKSRGQRQKFNTMVKRIEAGEANAILLWNLNRLSRNAGDTGIIIDLMDRGLLLEVKTPGQAFYNNPQDKFLLNLFCSNAKLENDTKAVDVRRGLKKKAELGWRPANAIIGYRSVFNESLQFKTIEPDPDAFPIIKRFFKQLLKEDANVHQLFLEATEIYQLRLPNRKNTITRSTFYRIFKNPFYYGEYEYPVGSGNWHKGKHKPMITKSEFTKLQKILKRNIKPNNSPAKDKLPYKKLLTCGECSMGITGSYKPKKQKNGTIHKYKLYHCTHKSRTHKCRQGSIQQKVIEQTVCELLKDIWMPEQFSQWALNRARAKVDTDKQTRKSKVTALQKKITALQSKQDHLVDMRADNEIDKDTFMNKQEVLNEDIGKLQEALSSEKNRKKQYLKKLETELEFVTFAVDQFKNGTFRKKRAIIKHLGCSRYIIDKKLVIEPKKELADLKRVRTELESRLGGLEPLKALNHRTLDALDKTSPILLGEWD